ncbi:hypothetical protein GJU43_11470 [Flavobacterium sp. LC2016-23]|uniref:hypothetical protein n=1 Tax=Flavobacterium sp. LC2016-23 TaxID=2666330 RepID=UPI0012B0B692|nr:hypothetical protein [Flavobacterium sp. LC2016-23]MRX39895.1 hypothetical protein [Flavobacterium sp. LC2016-23]
MNRIRKTVIFVSLLIIAFFASQANTIVVEKTETQKTDSTFSIEIPDSSAFIQPQASYHFAANVKTNYTVVAKWFDAILMIIPAHQAVKSVTNFANQHLNQSKKVLLLLFPFHYFW